MNGTEASFNHSIKIFLKNLFLYSFDSKGKRHILSRYFSPAAAASPVYSRKSVMRTNHMLLNTKTIASITHLLK
jgi:hypothetical protein